MSKFRENLLNKITKAEELQKTNGSGMATVRLTQSELKLVKIGLRTLDSYERIIEEECSIIKS